MSFIKRHVEFAALAIALVGAGGGAAWMFAPTPDEVAVRAALDHYLQGHATGDGVQDVRNRRPRREGRSDDRLRPVS